MTLSKPNASPATITTTRVAPAPISGLCVTCVDGCPGYCEVGRSALYNRISTGLLQLMAGERKFALRFIDRNDLMSLTREASDVSGITYVMESDMEEMEKILG